MEIFRRLNPFKKPVLEVETPAGTTNISDRFLTENLEVFQNLSPLQCRFILSTVDAELEISKGFDLEINEEEQFREKMAFLTLFNMHIKDIQQWKEVRGPEYLYIYENAQSLLFKELFHVLRDISKKYFDLFSRMDKLEVKNKYSVHLEATLATIFRAFWNDKFVA